MLSIIHFVIASALIGHLLHQTALRVFTYHHTPYIVSFQDTSYLYHISIDNNMEERITVQGSKSRSPLPNSVARRARSRSPLPSGAARRSRPRSLTSLNTEKYKWGRYVGNSYFESRQLYCSFCNGQMQHPSQMLNYIIS